MVLGWLIFFMEQCKKLQKSEISPWKIIYNAVVFFIININEKIFNMKQTPPVKNKVFHPKFSIKEGIQCID